MGGREDGREMGRRGEKGKVRAQLGIPEYCTGVGHLYQFPRAEATKRPCFNQLLLFTPI